MMSGIATMRPHVSAIGKVKCRPKPSRPRMQMLVDELGKRPADSVHLREIINSCAQYALQAAELLEELAPPRGAQAWNRFQRRLVVAPCAPLAVPGDRETMRFVAHALHKVQYRRFRREHYR